MPPGGLSAPQSRRALNRVSADLAAHRRTQRVHAPSSATPTPVVEGLVRSTNPSHPVVLHREQFGWIHDESAPDPVLKLAQLVIFRQPSSRLTTMVLQPHFAAEVRTLKPWNVRQARSRVDRLRKRYAVQVILAGGELRGELINPG